MNHVIIGGGAAGIAAARTLLKELPGDTVVMISEDEEVYSRCMLHRFISGERSAESINFVNDGLISCPRFKWIKGKSVTRLDGASKTVYAGDEELARGDTLIIATGANSVTPPIGDLKTAKNVYGLRHLKDARAIVEAAKRAEKIVVVGAGLVGLDAVAGLLELGEKTGKRFDITVVEMAPNILAINLDAHAAESYQRLFEKAGVKFLLAKKVVNTKSSPASGAGDNGPRISAVELESGESLACDMVVLAVGVRPAAAFLEGSGVKTERAITVNDRLETSVPGIYACGDVAGLSGIWPNAQIQGQTAAKNIAGWNLDYTDRFAVKNTVNFFDLVTLSVGAFNPAEGDETLVREDRNNYQKIVLRNGVPVGIVYQGDIAGKGYWQHLIKNGISVSGLGKSPWKVSYADFWGTENNGEFTWVKRE
ncbi:MAG: FAD-dependent oxidoreductase [Treponema sp.]|jgi:NAD(P)H-nitrite reductase large subunit|nr:FAD-dependent oxidoreductase [Treponema sp.]